MPGRGVPVINRFSAIVPFTVFPAQGESVQFQFHAGGQLVKQVTTQLAFGQWVADVDMSEFPASQSRYEVRMVVNYRNARNQLEPCAFDSTLSFKMIDVPWFNPWMAQRQVRFNAGAKQYEFSAVLPGVPAFQFNEPIDLEVTTLENRGTFGIPISEVLKIDGTWQGTAEAKVELILLGVNVLKEAFDVDTIQRNYTPSGGSYPGHTYGLDTIEIDLVKKHCVPIPYLSVDLHECVDLLLDEVCAGVMIGAQFCTRGFVAVDSTIKSDLGVNVTVAPSVTVSLPIGVEVDAVVCSGDAFIEPSATANLPLHCDVTPTFGCRFESPCLKLNASLHYNIECLGETLVSGDVGIGSYQWGCSAGAPPDETNHAPAQTRSTAPLSPHPTVASDGGGHALAVWKQEESSDPNNPDRRLYYSYYDGTTWSTPAHLSNQPALVEAPKVAFLGPNRALAVWVQNKLNLQQARGSTEGQLLSQNELTEVSQKFQTASTSPVGRAFGGG